MSIDSYLPVVFTALSVFILACWNPELLQVRKDGKATGQVSYGLVAVGAGLIGVASCWLLHQNGKKFFGDY